MNNLELSGIQQKIAETAVETGVRISKVPCYFPCSLGIWQRKLEWHGRSNRHSGRPLPVPFPPPPTGRRPLQPQDAACCSPTSASSGPGHSNVATDLNNLAGLLRATNRLSGAEPLYQRALVILIRFTLMAGHQHPNLEPVQSNYAQALRELGRTDAEIDAASTPSPP
jgi:hypothetical protein